MTVEDLGFLAGLDRQGSSDGRSSEQPIAVYTEGHPATAGNNRAVHLIRAVYEDYNLTLCGVKTPRRPQTTQEPLPKCRRCFG